MSFNTNPANAVTYITDPSASFLKVPVRVINNLNVEINKISENSFFNDDFFWLEMENDSSLYYDALDAKFLQDPITYTQTLTELGNFRLYPRFSPKTEFAA
tara:strand:- start:245 stop:547 length:303 start_codon:yes stop_codon:yes gene_type:complete